VYIQKIAIIAFIVLISKDALSAYSVIISDEKNIIFITSPILKKNIRNSKKKYYRIDRKQ